MYSRCRSVGLGLRPGKRPPVRAFAWPATERSLIERDLILAGQVAAFGAAVYGAAMFLVERISRMFWAWAQRDKDIEKAQDRMAKRLKDAGISPEVLDKAKDKAQEDAREPVRR